MEAETGVITATSQGTPKIKSHHQKLGRVKGSFYPESQSRPVKEYTSVILSHTAMVMEAMETEHCSIKYLSEKSLLEAIFGYYICI